MIKKIKYILLCLLVLATSIVSASFVNIKIYSNQKISSIKFAPISGKYVVYSDENKIFEFFKGTTLEIVIENDKIKIKKQDKDIGIFNNVKITGEGLLNSFRITPNNNEKLARNYDDDISLVATINGLRIINHVDFENYVSGVVEAETGNSKANIEFYKVQAIIVRTYAMFNLNKHAKEKAEYNLCDQQHCQVYKGRCKNPTIVLATSQTNGDIIVDRNRRLISAAFHSNCGGQTMNSQDVWKLETIYLKSVQDTFCLKQLHSRWKLKMPKQEWLDYLSSKYKYPVEDSIKCQKVLYFRQDRRKANLSDIPLIPLKSIRSDMMQKFKSTYFNIETVKDTVFFTGRGFGHGVGLCQEGALKMASHSWTYKNIIKYYYREVNIINIEELQ